MRKMAIYGNYINGRWEKSVSGKTFASSNPANKHVLGSFQQSTSEDVRKAIDAATDASERWSRLPAPSRANILFKIVAFLKKDKERLARLVTMEMGKVLQEGRGDIQEAIDIFEYMAGEGRRLFGTTTTSELQQKFCMTVRRPLGVVSLITPWNFPFAIPAWKLAPALICGNACLLKPSSDTPLCAVELFKILAKAGVPKGVVNLITGSGEEVGDALIKSKKIRGISFTGSKDTGEYIVKHAGVKKVGLELGGKNAIIVMDDADLSLALEGVLWGAFGTTGQRCTACSRVIVHEDVKKKFLQLLLKRTRKLRLGNGLDKKTDVGPLINKRAVEKTHYYTEIGVSEGAKLLCGGKKGSDQGFFYQPTIFDQVTPDMRIAREEIFGPSLSVLTVRDFEEAIEVCNAIEYGLSSSIYTKNVNQAFKAIERIDAGITYINSSTIGAEAHLPFGGVKGTGNGTREAGFEGINEFSETKTVYVDYSGKLQKAQIDIE